MDRVTIGRMYQVRLLKLFVGLPNNLSMLYGFIPRVDKILTTRKITVMNVCSSVAKVHSTVVVQITSMSQIHVYLLGNKINPISQP